MSRKAKRSALPARGEADIGGQRMTRPQRRSANLRAFPELGLVMRWPGVRAALAFLACLAGFHDVERSEKSASQAPWEPRQGSSFSRCYARPSEPASDGRVKSWTLARRSFGLASCPGPRWRAVRPWCRRGSCAPEAGRLTLALRRSGAGCRVCEAAIWRAVLASGLQGAPTQRASDAPRSRSLRARSARHWARDSAP